MKNDNCVAAELVKEAVLIKGKEFSIGDPVDEMSTSAGIQLQYLLKFGQDVDKFPDWTSYMYEWRVFIKDLLILIAQPGVLNKLPEEVQPLAAKRLDALIDFFHFIDERYTNEWLDYVTLTHVGTSNQEYINRITQYYTFPQTETGKTNFFNNDFIRERERFKKMQEAYKELHHGS